MRTKATLAATLVLPLLLIACGRTEQSPTAAGPSPERQAMAPSSQEQMRENPPPAPEQPSAGSTPPAPSSPASDRPEKAG